MSRRVLRLWGLGGSGESESKEEKAGTSQHEVLLSSEQNAEIYLGVLTQRL
jgi:hypothetical protein